MTLRRRVFLLSCVAFALVSCGGDGGNDSGVPDGAPSEVSSSADEWPAPNQDLGNRRVANSEIDSGNVNELGIAWTIPIQGGGTFGNYASTPIVADGVVYTQDLTSNVKAIDLESGDVKWSRDYNSPNVGPNGVAIGYDKIYGATSEFAFALNKDTGAEEWRSKNLIRNKNEGIDMAPGVFDGTMYVSTVPGNTKSVHKGNGAGVLWALDAETGQEKWKFWTVPEALWSAQHKNINSGGGLRHRPGVRRQRRRLRGRGESCALARDERVPLGPSRPGPNPHTNTLVKLNRENGEIIWERQVLPHDVDDWDLQLPPILTKDGDRDLVVVSGKLGIVYTVDAGDGSVVWQKAVGKHNGHDRDNELALAGQYDKMPQSPLTLLPGILGGVETQMAVEDGVVYAPVGGHRNRLPDAGEIHAADSQGDRRDGGAEPGRRLRQVEARPCAAGLRGGDDLERPGLRRRRSRAS